MGRSFESLELKDYRVPHTPLSVSDEERIRDPKSIGINSKRRVTINLSVSINFDPTLDVYKSRYL